MTLKHYWMPVCCCAVLACRGQDVSVTDEIAPPRPVYRYLIVVDTSSTMSRQKTLTIQTVVGLILNGMDGRIRTGDAWNLWTFDNQLHTNVFPAQMWDLRQRANVAERAQRLLRDLRFKKKKESLDQPLTALANEAQRSGALTAFLFTDGIVPVNGTPFDQSINNIFTQHAALMRKAKKPFVVVLVAQNGAFTAHAISPGGELPYVPRPQAPAALENNQNAGPSSPPAGTGTTPSEQTAERLLTVEQISEAIRHSKTRQTNPAPARPAPLILRGSNTNLIAPNPTNTATAAPASNALSLAPDKAPAEHLAATVPDTPPASAPTAQAQTPPDPPQQEDRSRPVETTVPQAPQDDKVADATEAAAANDAGEAPLIASPSPRTVAPFEPEPAHNPAKYLAAAVGLLLVTLGLAWLYVGRIRYVPNPGVISRSMEEDKKY